MPPSSSSHDGDGGQLIGLLAVDSPTLFGAWLALVVAGLGYYLLRTNYHAAGGTDATERPPQ